MVPPTTGLDLQENAIENAITDLCKTEGLRLVGCSETKANQGVMALRAASVSLRRWPARRTTRARSESFTASTDWRSTSSSKRRSWSASATKERTSARRRSPIWTRTRPIPRDPVVQWLLECRLGAAEQGHRVGGLGRQSSPFDPPIDSVRKGQGQRSDAGRRQSRTAPSWLYSGSEKGPRARR
jgi:hypothetical protein